MKFKSLPAIVLSTEPVNEIDLKVEFLTPAGRLLAVAKGGRKSQRRFLNLFSELNILRVNLRKSSRTVFPIIHSADLIYQVISPWYDRRKFEFFSYFTGLLSYIGRDIPEEGGFNFWISFIPMVDANPISEGIILLFQLKILKHLGYAPMLDECVRCGNKPKRLFYFSVERGGILCLYCADEGSFPLSVEEVKCLRNYLFIKNPREVFHLSPPSSKLSRLIRQFLVYYLDLDYKRPCHPK